MALISTAACGCVVAVDDPGNVRLCRCDEHRQVRLDLYLRYNSERITEFTIKPIPGPENRFIIDHDYTDAEFAREFPDGAV